MIAAITISTISLSYQKEQTVVQLKKVYSDFCSAVNISEAFNGPRSTWDFSLSGHDFFNSYLSPFITIRKVKKSDDKKEGVIYFETSGKELTTLTVVQDSAYIISLASGVQVFSGGEEYQTEAIQGFILDINGEKRPNKVGRDLFYIMIHKDIGVTPMYWNDGQGPSYKKSRSQLKNGPSSYRYQCNKQGVGLWCLALIMADDWQIKDDYPW